MDSQTHNHTFTEIQKFSQWWFWFLTGLPVAIFAYGVYKQFFLGEPFGSKPMSDTVLISCLVLSIFFFLFLRMLSLITEINKKHISVRFFPFPKKTFKLSDIKSAEVINYGFVGGYGIRKFTKHGTVYNIKGKEGLAITLKDDQKYVIGTQKKAEMERAVQSLKIN